jgi:DNA-binding response OmpR family regulator
MPRPTLLVGEPEPSQALSVRKLVLESAKFNVLTAHTAREAMDLFHIFPKTSGVILVIDPVMECEAVAKAVKQVTAKVPVIALSSRIGAKRAFADHHASSHQPEELSIWSVRFLATHGKRAKN